MKKQNFLTKIISIFLSLNLLLSNLLYPFTILAREVYEDDYYSEPPAAETSSPPQQQETPYEEVYYPPPITESPTYPTPQQQEVPYEETHPAPPPPPPASEPQVEAPQPAAPPWVEPERVQEVAYEEAHPTPAPTSQPQSGGVNVVTDGTSQQAAITNYNYQGSSYQSDYDNAYSEVRADLNPSPGPAYIAAQAPTAAVGFGEDLINYGVNTAQTAVSSTTQRRHQAEEDRLDKKLTEANALFDQATAARSKEIDAALNAPPEKRIEALAQVWNIPPQTPPSQVITTINQQVAGTGLKVEGDLNNFTFSAEDCLLDPLASCPDIQISPEQAAKNQQALIKSGLGVANFVTGGLESSVEEAVKLLVEMNALEEKAKQDGTLDLIQKYATSRYSRDVQIVSVLNNPDLSEEDRAKILQYQKDLVANLKQRNDVSNSAAANVAMQLASGPILKEVGGVAVSAAKPLIRPLGSVFEAAGGVGWGLFDATVGRVLSRGGQALVGEGDVILASGVELPEVVASGASSAEKFSEDILNKAIALAKETSGGGDEGSKLVDAIARALSNGLDVSAVRKNIFEATQLAEFMAKNGGKVPKTAPEGIRSNWQAVRINADGDLSALWAGQDTGQQFAQAALPDFADALFTQEANALKTPIVRAVYVANKRISQVGNFIRDHSPFQVPELNYRVSTDQIHVVNPDKYAQLVPNYANTAAVAVGDQVIIKDLVISNPSFYSIDNVFVHECEHTCQIAANPRGRQELVAVFGADNAGKWIEGGTEWTTQFTADTEIGRRIRAGLPIGELLTNPSYGVGYRTQITAINDQVIPEIMRLNDYTLEQAQAAFMASVRDPKILKNINGVEAAGKILDGVTSVKTGLGPQDPVGGITRIVSSIDLGKAAAGALTTVNLSGLAVITATTPNSSQNPTPVPTQQPSVPTPVPQTATPLPTNTLAPVVQPTPSATKTPKEICEGYGLEYSSKNGVCLIPSPTPSKQGFIFPKSVFAQEKTSDKKAKAVVMDAKKFDLLVKEQLIKQALEEDGKVDSDYVKEVLKTDVIKPKIEKTSKGYILTTDEKGNVQANVEKARYAIKVKSLPDVDISASKSIDLQSGAEAIIQVGVKKGSGSVNYVSLNSQKSQKFGFNIVKTALAQGQDTAKKDNLPKVKVVVFSDSNNNGKMDDNETILALAGVQVTIEKSDTTESVKLVNGWNLITIPAIPQKPISASSLLGEIAKQGGYATTVSTLSDGAWKSYVVRGNQDYSGEDFVVEVGKAYFVKVLKPVEFKFSGQEFVTPLKTKLTSGWNAVGLPKTKKAYQASGIIDEINSKNGSSDAVSRWQLSLWDTLVKKQEQKYGKDFIIENNKGYLIRLDKGGEFEL